jgi:hypothetical protein
VRSRVSHFLSEMKHKTRDDLIYLTVGIGITAVVVADFIYADSHNTKMWMPSRFAFRAVSTPGLLAYFVVREMRRKNATYLQTFASILFATLVQLGVLFGFRQLVDQLPGMSFSALAVIVMFLIMMLTLQFARLLRQAPLNTPR